LASKRAEINGTTQEDELEKMKNLVPSKKIGEPKDMGYAALYLASDEAHYIKSTESRRQKLSTSLMPVITVSLA